MGKKVNEYKSPFTDKSHDKKEPDDDEDKDASELRSEKQDQGFTDVDRRAVDPLRVGEDPHVTSPTAEEFRDTGDETKDTQSNKGQEMKSPGAEPPPYDRSPSSEKEIPPGKPLPLTEQNPDAKTPGGEQRPFTDMTASPLQTQESRRFTEPRSAQADLPKSDPNKKADPDLEKKLKEMSPDDQRKRVDPDLDHQG